MTTPFAIPQRPPYSQRKLRLIPFPLYAIPSHPLLASQQQAPISTSTTTSTSTSRSAPPPLRTFILETLTEAISFADEFVPTAFSTKGALKDSAPSKAKVQLLSYEDKGHVESWFARRSEHDDEMADGTASWREFSEGILDNHSIHEMEYTPDVFDAHKVLDWSEEIHAIQDAAGTEGGWQGYGNVVMEIYEMAHHIPPPLNNRVFPVLVVRAMTPSAVQDLPAKESPATNVSSTPTPVLSTEANPNPSTDDPSTDDPSHSASSIPVLSSTPSASTTAPPLLSTEVSPPPAEDTATSTHSIPNPNPESNTATKPRSTSTDSKNSSFIIVQIPINLHGVQSALYSTGRHRTVGDTSKKREKVTLGAYVSVERVRLVGDDDDVGKVETQSHAQAQAQEEIGVGDGGEVGTEEVGLADVDRNGGDIVEMEDDLQPANDTNAEEATTATTATTIPAPPSILPPSTSTPETPPIPSTISRKKIIWEMATSSDAKGWLPMSVQKMGVPGAIVKDVGLFLEWVGRGRKE